MSDSQIVTSRGPFHGLPVYADSQHTGLTAMVTGANGMSGYHMVRVLAAAPSRWEKIFCLSRKSPPSNFFDDLGEGANRVEHISVDFLDDPVVLGEKIKDRIKRLDYVFFFSYMQPQQKGEILGMWSDAQELSDLNARLMENFICGLTHSGLIPKRFLLQTGAKHYGFHIGPAMNPSFESDPRIVLEPNFYYPQEDLLKEYCKLNETSWNVIRPSYIIGAVRESALNYLIGLAIYGAVQAHLERPLDFPGDFTAWDREFCQSTALLNAYFEEWVVLTGQAGNEAFNIQDGQPFTWGRFWPYLASWYGTKWTAPEADESKYHLSESRWKETPRGYGAIGTTRSTFSFQEWSGRPEVQQAWRELAQIHSISLDPFTLTNRSQIFAMTDSAVIGGWALSLSMRKARRLGFLGVTDSYETAFIAIWDLARLKVVAPPVMQNFQS